MTIGQFKEYLIDMTQDFLGTHQRDSELFFFAVNDKVLSLHKLDLVALGNLKNPEATKLRQATIATKEDEFVVSATVIEDKREKQVVSGKNTGLDPNSLIAIIIGKG